MAVIFHDLFEELSNTLLENHTPDTAGTGWTKRYSTASTAVIYVKPTGQSGASNVVGPSTSESSVTSVYGINPAPSTTDVTLEADRYMLNWEVSNSYSAGMFARLTNNGGWSGYFVQMVPNLHSAASIRLYKKVTDTTTLLASYDHTFANGDVVTFECNDAAKRVLVNGVEVINNTDNTVTGTGDAGLYWGNFVFGSHLRAEMEFGYLKVADGSPAGQTVDLAANSAGDAGVTVNLQPIRDLAASVVGETTVTVALSVGTTIDLGAQADGSAGVTAALKADWSLTAGVAGTSTITATIEADRSLAASVTGTSTVTASLETLGEVTLDASVAGEAGATAALAVDRSLAAGVAGTSTVTATLEAIRSLAAGVTGTSTITATPAVTRDFAAVAAGETSLVASLAVVEPVDLSAVVAGSSQVDADLTVDVYVLLAAEIIGVSTAQASMSILTLGAVGDVQVRAEIVTRASLNDGALVEIETWGEPASEATLADALFADVQTAGRLVTVAAGSDEAVR